MIIYKFGGASVKDADSVRKLGDIISVCPEPIIVVVSAMGKTTNRLEMILDEAIRNSGNYIAMVQQLKNDHLAIVDQLISNRKAEVVQAMDTIFTNLLGFLAKSVNTDYNYAYDQVVSFGELLSTKIVSHYLQTKNIVNTWIDIRKFLKTNSNFRDAAVDLQASATKCKTLFTFENVACYITQGFIGSDNDGNTTTLGREGSDYSAALLANFLEADAVTLWKDVPGIFNADPAMFNKVEHIAELSYHEVIELTYYGAKVIHPKTIKPLYEKEIPLYVRSFLEPALSGTLVHKSSLRTRSIPIIIIKDQQILVSISHTDLSFISEQSVSRLFALLDDFRIKANLLQHSAISFSVGVDTPKGKAVNDLITALRKNFKVLYNEGLQLITIRNYTDAIIEELTQAKKILIEQRSRHTVQFLVEDKN
ncbi:MAG: aspartate kinase [Bacteroidales bacterium]|nr:aspartate kinase [Bacteroidales bacterium]